MKILAFILVLLSFSAFSQEKEVVTCKSASKSHELKIDVDEDENGLKSITAKNLESGKFVFSGSLDETDNSLILQTLFKEGQKEVELSVLNVADGFDDYEIVKIFVEGEELKLEVHGITFSQCE